MVLSWAQSAATARVQRGGERAKADGESAVAGDGFAACMQGFADEGVGPIADAGVAAVQRAGEAGLGVERGHLDRVGNQLGLSLELD